jgi:hypothetical protein
MRGPLIAEQLFKWPEARLGSKVPQLLRRVFVLTTSRLVLVVELVEEMIRGRRLHAATLRLLSADKQGRPARNQHG